MPRSISRYLASYAPAAEPIQLYSWLQQARKRRRAAQPARRAKGGGGVGGGGRGVSGPQSPGADAEMIIYSIRIIQFRAAFFASCFFCSESDNVHNSNTCVSEALSRLS